MFPGNVDRLDGLDQFLISSIQTSRNYSNFRQERMRAVVEPGYGTWFTAMAYRSLLRIDNPKPSLYAEKVFECEESKEEIDYWKHA